MPEIMVNGFNRRTADDMIQLIRTTIEKWPLSDQAMFFMKFTREFASKMKAALEHIKEAR